MKANRFSIWQITLGNDEKLLLKMFFRFSPTFRLCMKSQVFVFSFVQPFNERKNQKTFRPRPSLMKWILQTSISIDVGNWLLSCLICSLLNRKKTFFSVSVYKWIMEFHFTVVFFSPFVRRTLAWFMCFFICFINFFFLSPQLAFFFVLWLLFGLGFMMLFLYKI